jgi:hypothetical protein
MLIVGIFTAQSKIKVMNKTQLIEMLEGPASAEFTFMPVSKVVELIKQLEEAPSTSLDSKSLVDFLEKFKAEVLGRVKDTLNGYDYSDAADKDSAEFSIGYNNRLELDSIDVDLSGLQDEIESDLEELFDETISDLEKEEESVEEVTEVEA